MKRRITSSEYYPITRGLNAGGGRRVDYLECGHKVIKKGSDLAEYRLCKECQAEKNK